MTLLSLALKNVKNNLKNYLLYFISTITSIVIFFIFSSLKYLPATSMKVEASQKIAAAMSSISFVIVVFVAIFIWMTNAFFVRSRKKEIGIYIFSGMKQDHVALLLLMENLLIGLFSIGMGLIFGMLLSRLATLMLVKMMGLNAFVSFYIAPRAFIDTLIVFSIIFALTSLSSATMVYRFKVIELFNAHRSEEVAPKNSKLQAFVGLALMLSGYALSQLIPYAAMMMLPAMLGTLILTISGTYLFFNSFLLFVLSRLKQRPSHIFKGVNILSTNHLQFRIKQNARAMATIAVLAASTISTLGIMLSIIDEITTIQSAYVPNTLQAFCPQDKANTRDTFLDQVIADKKFEVTYDGKVDILSFKGHIADEARIKPEPFMEKLDFGLIAASQIEQLVQDSGLRKHLAGLDLNNNEAVLLSQPYNHYYFGGYGKTEKIPFELNNGQKFSIVRQELDHFIPSNLYLNFVVVSDETYQQMKTEAFDSTNLRVMGISDPMRTFEINDEWTKLSKSDREGIKITTYGEVKALLNADKGINLFVTIFVCLLFVMASGSVIYFKQLTDAVSEISKYETLYKLGISHKDVKKTIGKQLRFMFGAPYVVAVVHSFFALLSLSRMLGQNLFKIGLISCIAFLMLYVLFYLGTKQSYIKVITRKEFA
jgi:putative ABC transport system permease protein